MSYILQALKRAERERALGDVPTLGAPVPAPIERRSGWWPWLLGALLIANVAALAYVFWPAARGPAARGPAIAEAERVDNTASGARAERDLAAVAALPPVRALPQAVSDEVPPASVAPVAAPRAQSVPRAADVVVDSAINRAADPYAPVRTSPSGLLDRDRESIKARVQAAREQRRQDLEMAGAERTEVSPVPPASGVTTGARGTARAGRARRDPPLPAPAHPSDPTQELADQILSLRESEAQQTDPPAASARRGVPAATGTAGRAATAVLPLRSMSPAFQEALPKMHIAALMYFDDGARSVVIINGRRYREGEMVEAKVQIEQIIRDGVVLRYQGKTFLLPQFR